MSDSLTFRDTSPCCRSHGGAAPSSTWCRAIKRASSMSRCLNARSIGREQWFLDAVEDPERRRYYYLFSGPSMAKLVKLKDARAWARWLKEQFTDADRRAQSAVEFGFAPASRRRFRQGL